MAVSVGVFRSMFISFYGNSEKSSSSSGILLLVVLMVIYSGDPKARISSLKGGRSS